jgi:transcriptional regulator with XRE-family HTH domain
MPPTARRRDLGRHTVSAQLRDVIDSRGLTPYAVAKLSDIDPGMVARFVSGERDLRLGTVDRIAAALGLRLVEVGRAKGRVSRPVETSS